MNTKLIGFIILGVILIGVATWQLVDFRAPGRDQIPAPTKIQTPTGAPESAPPTSKTPTADGDKMKEESMPTLVGIQITVEGDEFSFSPANISVERGATVELTFKNVGAIPHNYIVDELGLGTKTIDAGQTDVVTFTTPSAAGSITYASYCSIPGHREAGMEGLIVIE